MMGRVCFRLAAGVLAVALPALAALGGECVAAAFNVRHFGAKGDGRTPDSAAIQKALDAAGAVKGTVFFPAGEYLCHDLRVPEKVCLRADPAWLYRNEKAGAILQLDDHGAKCLLNLTRAFGAHVYGLFLSGARNTPAPVHGILLDNPEKWSEKEDSVVIDDVKVGGFSGHGVYLNRIWLFIIRHSHFMGNGGDGVRIRGWDGFVTDNQFSGNGGSGFACEGCGATVMFTANRVEWNKGFGLYVCNGDAWNVTGNCFDRNWCAGLCAEGVAASTFTGNVFRRCGKDSNLLKPGERSCQVRLTRCSGVTFTGNSCLAGRDDGGTGKFTPQVGLVLDRLTSCVVKDNALHRGYMDEMILDLGGHSADCAIRDNVGTKMK